MRRWWVETLGILLPRTSFLRCYLRSRASRRGHTVPCRLPIVLLHYGVTRLVTVILSVKVLLLFGLRIPTTGILPLVKRQRSRSWSGITVPSVPPASMPLPSIAPMLAPTWRRIGPPSAKVPRRVLVVTHGDAQDKQRHIFRGNKIPRAVVPGTRVPVVLLVDPVHTIVKEVVRIQLWCIVDWVARYRDKVRERGNVDSNIYARKSDADTYLGDSRGRRTKQHPQHNQQITHFLFLFSFTGLRGAGKATPLPLHKIIQSGREYRVLVGTFCALTYKA
jgi:hypothetical protein